MKRDSLMVVFLLPIMFGCRKPNNDLNQLNIKGNVDSVTDSLWYATEKFGEVCKESLCGYSITDFDKHGNIVSCTEFNADGDIENKQTYTYDECTLVEQCCYDGSGKLTEKHAYLSDKGKIIKETIKYHSSIYDYYFNSQEGCYYYTKDRLDSIVFFTPELGRCAARLYFKDNSGYGYKNYAISAMGTMDSSTIYLDDGGRKIKVIEKSGIYTYSYNSNGDVEERHSPGRMRIRYKYKYDRKNNWVEQIAYVELLDKVSENNTLINVVNRHISYTK